MDLTSLLRKSLIALTALGLVGCSAGGDDPVGLPPADPEPAAEVAQALATPTTFEASRSPVVSADLAAQWTLDSGARTVSDRAGLAVPSMLTLDGDDDAIAAHGTAGVVVADGASLRATLSAPARDAINDAFTLEIWFETVSSDGPFVVVDDADGEAVVSLSLEPGADGDCETSLRLDMVGIVSLDGCLPPNGLTHATATLTADAAWLYLDGEEVGTGRGGPVDGIAGLRTGDGWVGLVSSVSLFSRAVVEDEVLLHTEAGPRGLVGDGPEVLPIPDVSVSPGEAVAVVLDAFDWSGDDVTITADVRGLPGGTVAIEDESTVLRWTPTGADIGTHVVTVEASDGVRRSGTSFVINVFHAAGVPSLLAGSGVRSTNGNGGPATFAGLNNPGFVAVSTEGSVFIADYDASIIRRVGPDGVITTVAGSGVSGFTGDGIVAGESLMSNPTGLAFGPDGSLYYADHNNHRIRRIRPDGVVVSVAGNGLAGFSGDGGPALDASLWSPEDVAVDAAGMVYVTDQDNHVVRRIDTDGIITTVAGTGEAGAGISGLPAIDSPLNAPAGIVIRDDGTIIFSDERDHVVWSVGTDGLLTRVAGIGQPGFSGDGGSATGARLQRPTGLVLSAGGLLYIADTDNNVIRLVDLVGTIWTLANDQPAFDGGGTPLSGVPVRDLAWDGSQSRLIAASPTTGRVWAISGLE